MLSIFWVLGALAVLPFFFDFNGDETDGEAPVSTQPTEGDDSLEGTEGDDSISGFSGNDTLSGGDGDDWLEGHFGDDLVNGEAGNDTLLGRGDADTLIGGAGNDDLFAGDVNVSIDGGQGDDRLFFYGDSTLTGGAGQDQFTYSADVAMGPVGYDMPDAQPAVITDFDPAQDKLALMLEATLEGDIDQPLALVDWADGTGADLTFGDQVLAKIVGAQGMDPALIDVTLAINTAAGVTYHDGDQGAEIQGGTGPERIYGGGGDDIISVGRADSKEGQDLLGDFADGGAGNDTLTGRGGSSYFDSDDSDDTQGAQVAFIHEDTLIGGAGDDVLRAINGSQLTGGAGADRFEVVNEDLVMPAGVTFPPARITDFDPLVDTLAVSSGSEGDWSVVVWPDELGADVLVGTTVVAKVTGGQGLTVADLVTG